MSEVPAGELGDAVRQYLRQPDFGSMRRVENALRGLPPDIADVIRSLLEMTVDATHRASAGEERAREFKDLLTKSLERAINNIAQLGSGNTGQIGDGSQTVSGTEPQKDGKKR